MMTKLLKIKPHHLVDIIMSFSKGLKIPDPHPYDHAVHTVTERILREPGLEIQIELGADDICAPCVHNINGLCDDTIDISFRPDAPPAKVEYNLLLDHRWCQRLGLEQGNVLSISDFCQLLRDRSGKLEEIYRELPSERVRKKEQELQLGLFQFLHNRKTSR